MRRWYRTPLLRQAGHFAQYYPARMLIGAIGALPGSIRARACSGVARLARGCMFVHSRRALRNLEMAFPDRAVSDRRRILSGMYRHFALFIDDVARMRRIGEVEDRVIFDQVEDLRRIVRPDRGVVIGTGHFGNWEVGAATLARHGFEVAVVSRRFRNPLIQRRVQGFRRAQGIRVIFADEGLKPMQEVLRNGGVLAIVADKRLRRAQIEVEFFGRPVKMPAGPALLAKSTGAPLVCGAAVREASGDYRLILEDPVFPEKSGRGEVVRLSQAYMTGLERIIRRFPEQWIWFHDRWRGHRWERLTERTA